METVVFCTPPSASHRTAEENLGIGYLAAFLRSVGYHVVVVDGWLRGMSGLAIAHEIAAIKNTIFIGISCYITSIQDVADLVRGLRASGVTAPVVAGGYGPTLHWSEFLTQGNCDYVIRGEGENSLVPFITYLQGQSDAADVPGLVRYCGGEFLHSRPGQAVTNLDDLPYPSRDAVIHTMALGNPVHLSTSRGCRAHCHFCAIITFDRQMQKTPSWRHRSVVSSVDEIASLHEQYGVTHFKIVDDSFIEPPRDAQWAEAFAAELARRNLHIQFRTQVRADRINRDIVSSLRSAGWFATSLGVENFSADALRRMNKSATVTDNLRALQLLKESGVYVQMGMILFDHATTVPELEENYAALSSLAWPVTKGIFTEMYAAPYTAYASLLAKGGVAPLKLGNYCYDRSSKLVEGMYQALKLWHKSHSVVYDEAINPISAPKAISQQGYSDYHRLCMDLFHADVELFGELLQIVRSGGTATDLTAHAAEAVENSRDFFASMRRQLETYNRAYGISYDANPNLFL